MSDGMEAKRDLKSEAGGAARQVDVVVVGAGFAGLYMLHRLRNAGFTTQVLDDAEDVGGTWYWNRYPGARCDIQTLDYTYSFDPELEKAWEWSEKYARQPEILRYLGFVADRYDLRRDITFQTRVTAAVWDEAAERWLITTDGGETISCRYYIMATGCLSAPKTPEIDGVGDFRGEVYTTGRWPHEDVDFTGKRVAVIGTGSSGIQAIPLIAQQASHLTVFQRTPSFALPARNGPPSADRAARLAKDRDSYREQSRWSFMGVPWPRETTVSWQLSDADRRKRFEKAWEKGDLTYYLSQLWADQNTNLEGSAIIGELIREKIREIVKDPETAEILSPKDDPFGSKRPCLDSGYYETYNRDNVTLVNVREEPIRQINATGVSTSERQVDVDVIVFATGFDAMTGAIMAVKPITGRGGQTLAQTWADGPKTYLGLTTSGFPNLFMITGPGSPSVLSNMAVSIEQHVDWIADRLEALRDAGFTTIEATQTAQAGWEQHLADCSRMTLHRLANTWYTGANVEGKSQGVMPYTGSVGLYRAICNDVVDHGMLGFRLAGPGKSEQCNDGEIARLQPDVRFLLKRMTDLKLPPVETMGVAGARAFTKTVQSMVPPGRAVGEVVDGTLPGAEGALAYRLYRPETPGPHPIMVYFHGGGWVLGDEGSDDQFCRDMCRRTGMIVVSVGYRHAPEDVFPAAAEDGYAATCWIAENAVQLGGQDVPVTVSGWSAGGNIAAVTCQLVRDRGGPQIAGQLLVCPVTDCDLERPSYAENAEGYYLTTSLVRWFWDTYCPPAQRTDPRVAPLRGNLENLPPALVVTAEFDPLRDEGIAYAEAMSAAGVEVEQIKARGHIHGSFTMVDVVVSGASGRKMMADWLCRRVAEVPSEIHPNVCPAPEPSVSAPMVNEMM